MTKTFSSRNILQVNAFIQDYQEFEEKFERKKAKERTKSKRKTLYRFPFSLERISQFFWFRSKQEFIKHF